MLDDANVNLNKVMLVVFDEADRLFEIGFAGQLQELLKRLSKVIFLRTIRSLCNLKGSKLDATV